MTPEIDKRVAGLIKDLSNKNLSLSSMESRARENVDFCEAITERSKTISKSIALTASKNKGPIEDSILTIANWMKSSSVVRVLGAGRAKLAVSIPANRLSHGGAKVYMQDTIMPMPHTAKGGGVIAASASGETPSVIGPMKALKDIAPHIMIIGMADHKAEEFAKLCDIFIGIHKYKQNSQNLFALADLGEFVISELFDAITVAAGRLTQYDSRRWKLGHENIGATGPYDSKLDFPNIFGDD